MTGTPGYETDQRWFRIARISFATLAGAGLAMAIGIEYMERGSHLAQAELEALLLIGLLPAWMLWSAIAAGRLAQKRSAPRGIVAALVLALMVIHLLWPASFIPYLDLIEPLAAAWLGWWFLVWLIIAAGGAWLTWMGPAWIDRWMP